MASPLWPAAPGLQPSRPHTCWPIWSGGERIITSCVLTTHCEWHLRSPKHGWATVWRNAIGSERLPWPPVEPADDGQRMSCSRAPCQRLALERHRSQMELAVSCCGEMGEDIPSRAREEPYAGKRRPVKTASSPKTSQQWVWRGLVELSTMSNSSTHSGARSSERRGREQMRDREIRHLICKERDGTACHH